MATAPALLSIDEYLRTSYKPDVDYVDGELEERSVGEYSHGKTQQFIEMLFTSHEDQWLIDAVIEQRVRVSPTRVRIPDVTVLHVGDPQEDVVTNHPPLLCIEVLSPEDRLARAELVMADYRDMGVPNIWLIDPIRRVAYTYGANGTRMLAGTKLTVPGTEIVLDLTWLFAKLDAAIARRGKAS